MQRIIAQIGGKPIAVQIQQSPHQQQQQQKILAKVLTNSSGGQIISVESLLTQKGLKLATTGHANQLNRQGKQVIQAQYQVNAFYILHTYARAFLSKTVFYRTHFRVNLQLLIFNGLSSLCACACTCMHMYKYL